MMDKYKQTFMQCDLVRTYDFQYFYIDMPGFDIADIKVKIDDNYLNVYGKRSRQYDEMDIMNISERVFGEFHRSFFVGDINKKLITAKMDNGVLIIKMPIIHELN